MGKGSERQAPSFVTVWVTPVVVVVALAAVVAYFGSHYGDWSFSFVFGWILVAVFGTAAWLLGIFALYEAAAKRLGWQCSTGPQVTPDGRSIVADILIRGELRGRPFTLSRLRSVSTGRRVTFSSSVEWTGKDIEAPAFSLRLTSASNAGLSGITGSTAIAEAIVGAFARGEAAHAVRFAEGTRLARRATLTAPDPAAALAYFTTTRCDALDALVDAGSLHGESARIVINASGFPMPWRLEAFLEHVDEIRNVLVG